MADHNSSAVTPAYGRNNFRVVNSRSDFPPTVAGEIVLLPDTTYLMDQKPDQLVTPDTIVFSENSVLMRDDDVTELGGWTYTGTGAAIKAVGVDVRIRGIKVFAPNGALFDLTDSPFVFIEVLDVEALDLGTCSFSGGTAALVMRQCRFREFVSPLKIVGALGLFDNVLLGYRPANGVPGVACVDFGVSTVGFVLFNKTFFTLSEATQVGLASFDGSNPIGLARVSGCSFVGGKVYSGFDQGTLRWQFLDNTGAFDSERVATWNVKDNTTLTVIALVGVFQPIAFDMATFSPGSRLERFVILDTATGEIEYQGESQFRGSILVAITAIKQGASRLCKFRAVVNGLPMSDAIEASLEIRAFSVATALVAPVIMNPGDTLLLEVQNVDDGQDVTVTDVQFMVS